MFSPDGHQVLSAAVDQSVRVWEMIDREAGLLLPGHSQEVKAVAVSPDGKLLASGSDDETVKLWDLATGTVLHTLVGHVGIVRSVAFSVDSRKLVSTGEDQAIKIWDAAGGKELKSISGPSPHMPALAMTPDGKRFIVWAVSLRLPGVPEVHIFDLETGNHLKQIHPHDRLAACLAFSPDGDLVAMGDQGGAVRIWNLAKNQREGEDRPVHHTIGDLIFSPDRKLLITGGDDGDIKIWDVSKSKPERTVKAHKHQVVAFAINSDGSRFASASLQDQEVKLWETATGKELRRWPAIAVRNLAFSPDGKYVATANYNSTLYLLECP
jgi:tricorn protease-like protein